MRSAGSPAIVVAVALGVGLLSGCGQQSPARRGHPHHGPAGVSARVAGWLEHDGCPRVARVAVTTSRPQTEPSEPDIDKLARAAVGTEMLGCRGRVGGTFDVGALYVLRFTSAARRTDAVGRTPLHRELCVRGRDVLVADASTRPELVRRYCARIRGALVPTLAPRLDVIPPAGIALDPGGGRVPSWAASPLVPKRPWRSCDVDVDDFRTEYRYEEVSVARGASCDGGATLFTRIALALRKLRNAPGADECDPGWCVSPRRLAVAGFRCADINFATETAFVVIVCHRGRELVAASNSED